MAVGQRPQKIGEFGVAMLIDEPRHGITERRPHGSPTRGSLGPRLKPSAAILAEHLTWKALGNSDA